MDYFKPAFAQGELIQVLCIIESVAKVNVKQDNTIQFLLSKSCKNEINFSPNICQLPLNPDLPKIEIVYY